MITRVLYVIDHQKPGKDRWDKPETSTTLVTKAGDAAAQEIAEKFQLAETWVAQKGCRIRVRVWPNPDDFLTFDPESAPADGTWIHEPKEAR